MLSDLHFDPMRDPGKVARLAAAPEAEWAAILREPASPNDAEAFAAIQAKCGTRNGLDPDYSLMNSALLAAAKQAPAARFVTVSGDLLVHQFDCRWKLASGHKSGYADFAEKTASFVIRQVEAAFPHVPVYVALGNNDVSCGDYSMDLHDRFFAATSPAVIAGLVGATQQQRTTAEADYKAGGYFNAPLPGLGKARLIAVDDIFLSRRYKTCAGKDSPAEAATVLAWLSGQLQQAKVHGESVWILAHIPPGLDVYSTITKNRNVCGGDPPDFFLADNAFAELLARYPDTVRLAQFGHTHSDEFRVFGAVPAKIIGAVTPINGNLPTFTVGQVDRHTAQLVDYTVYQAADKSGTGPWAREYNFHEAYKAPAYTAAALRTQIADFRNDPDSTTEASKVYEQGFFPGSPSPLALIWPQASCALADSTAAGYKSCVCKQ